MALIPLQSLLFIVMQKYLLIIQITKLQCCTLLHAFKADKTYQ